MTTRAALLVLADRVEREEPTPELAMQVIMACGWSRPNGPRENRWHHPVHGWRDGGPDPLHSLDAAASLIGPTWMATMTDVDDDGWVVMLHHPLLQDVSAHAPTEAQARTAAALRAMAQEMKDE